jgi:hypothetical protein
MLFTSNDFQGNVALQKLIHIVFPPGLTVFDPTYGNGTFWRGWDRALIGGDKDRTRARDVQLDFRNLPLRDQSVDLVVFDPPFQPQTTRGKIENHYSAVPGGVPAVRMLFERGLTECWRVAKVGLIVKCQDYIHDHRPVWMSLWAYDVLGEPYDFMTVRTQKTLRARNWTRQRSVWRNHSTYWVWSRQKFR